MSHLVIMAAGTGGHIIPGLAVAREMIGRGWSVSWLGTATGMENQLVPAAGIAIDTIGFAGLRGKSLVQTLTGGLRLLKAFWDAFGILRRRGADAVLGMGGYVCFPGGMMASLLGKPLVLVNADAALLLSNKALLPVADRVAFGFDGAAARVRQWPPAPRCAPRPPRCRCRPSAGPAAPGRCACWWSAAAWARACSTRRYRPRWR
jgi:UDP-N-acetylglucosamine--N-acetylmuramyl-(pentapeptide) pyrophosphoryl-undecaprenol N-acetylglucosamine transferase